MQQNFQDILWDEVEANAHLATVEEPEEIAEKLTDSPSIYTRLDLIKKQKEVGIWGIAFFPVASGRLCYVLGMEK